MPESYAHLWYRPTPRWLWVLSNPWVSLENGNSGSLDRLMLSVRYNLK